MKLKLFSKISYLLRKSTGKGREGGGMLSMWWNLRAPLNALMCDKVSKGLFHPSQTDLVTYHLAFYADKYLFESSATCTHSLVSKITLSEVGSYIVLLEYMPLYGCPTVVM